MSRAARTATRPEPSGQMSHSRQALAQISFPLGPLSLLGSGVLVPLSHRVSLCSSWLRPFPGVALLEDTGSLGEWWPGIFRLSLGWGYGMVFSPSAWGPCGGHPSPGDQAPCHHSPAGHSPSLGLVTGSGGCRPSALQHHSASLPCHTPLFGRQVSGRCVRFGRERSCFTSRGRSTRGNHLEFVRRCASSPHYPSVQSRPSGRTGAVCSVPGAVAQRRCIYRVAHAAPPWPLGALGGSCVPSTRPSPLVPCFPVLQTPLPRSLPQPALPQGALGPFAGDLRGQKPGAGCVPRRRGVSDTHASRHSSCP